MTVPQPKLAGRKWRRVVTSGAYTPKVADNDRCLRATATYTDNIPGDAVNPDDTTDNDGDPTTRRSNMDGIAVFSWISEKPVQLSEPDNTAPEFQDQDLAADGDQSDEATARGRGEQGR